MPSTAEYHLILFVKLQKSFVRWLFYFIRCLAGPAYEQDITLLEAQPIWLTDTVNDYEK